MRLNHQGFNCSNACLHPFTYPSGLHLLQWPHRWRPLSAHTMAATARMALGSTCSNTSMPYMRGGMMTNWSARCQAAALQSTRKSSMTRLLSRGIWRSDTPKLLLVGSRKNSSNAQRLVATASMVSTNTCCVTRGRHTRRILLLTMMMPSFAHIQCANMPRGNTSSSTRTLWTGTSNDTISPRWRSNRPKSRWNKVCSLACIPCAGQSSSPRRMTQVDQAAAGIHVSRRSKTCVVAKASLKSVQHAV